MRFGRQHKTSGHCTPRRSSLVTEGEKLTGDGYNLRLEGDEIDHERNRKTPKQKQQ